MLSFQTETFQCTSNDKVTQVSVSKQGNGIIAVAGNRYLYHISMKPFCEPRRLADLYLDFGANDDDNLDDDEDAKRFGAKYNVHSIKWSSCDRRIAVIYKKDNGESTEVAKFVGLWAYDFSSVYRLGFVSHPHETFPLDVTFRNQFNSGALLAILWNNGIISQHHLCFN